MRIIIYLLLLGAIPGIFPTSTMAGADNPSVKSVVEQTIAAAGGEENLLKIFRFHERVLITATPTPLIAGETKGNRTSVVEVGGRWWIGTNKRNKDKVRILCWAWSLRILLDDKSKVEVIPDIVVDNKPVYGLRVTGSIETPIDLFFDKESRQIKAIDYTDTRHLLSNWKKTAQGSVYPAHVAGYRFTDRDLKTITKSQWYQTDILKLTPLEELPVELR
tara:strand:+ start:500 stop:1156 length:657 start_codon:yes stop_codon:yes gene_type:complete